MLLFNINHLSVKNVIAQSIGTIKECERASCLVQLPGHLTRPKSLTKQ